MLEYFEYILKLANNSLVTDDIPVGAIIVKNNEIIGEGWNTREKDNFILGHAEINAIKMASNYLNSWNLSDCELYVTLKPCSMCLEAIKQSRIKNVYYLLEKPSNKREFSKTLVNCINIDPLRIIYERKLSDFFKKLREK